MKKLLLAGAAVLLLTTGVAAAQPAAREGNTWDWRHHQPTRARTLRKEKAAGIEPTGSERAITAATMHHIDRHLLDQSSATASPQGFKMRPGSFHHAFDYDK